MFKELLNLYLLFFKMGAVTFGGGYAMLPILEKELSEERDWVTQEELLDYYAIGQSTPGIIAINVSTFVGYKRKGLLGAIASTAGMVSPSIIIISIIAKFITNFNDIPTVNKALFGINIAVAVLLANSIKDLAKKSIIDINTALIAIVAFILVNFFNIKTVAIIVTAAVVAIILKKVKGELK